MKDREIKFRAWGVKTNKWVYPVLDVTINMSKHNSYIIEQFTGLKDKLGKDVYEGDVLQLDNSEQYDMFQMGYFNEKVTVSDIRMLFSELNSMHDLYHFKSNYMKILGNIHQNPELLK